MTDDRRQVLALERRHPAVRVPQEADVAHPDRRGGQHVGTCTAVLVIHKPEVTERLSSIVDELRSRKPEADDSSAGTRRGGPDHTLLFEVAWEVCWQLGGIYTPPELRTTTSRVGAHLQKPLPQLFGACAVESNPLLRQPPCSSEPVTFEEIMDALAELDRIDRNRQERQTQRPLPFKRAGSVASHRKVRAVHVGG
mgnify:CR=1 FL=1